MRPIPAHAFLAVAVIPLTVTGNEQTLLEEIIVTASFVGSRVDGDTADPCDQW